MSEHEEAGNIHRYYPRKTCASAASADRVSTSRSGRSRNAWEYTGPDGSFRYHPSGTPDSAEVHCGNEWLFMCHPNFLIHIIRNQHVYFRICIHKSLHCTQYLQQSLFIYPVITVHYFKIDTCGMRQTCIDRIPVTAVFLVYRFDDPRIFFLVFFATSLVPSEDPSLTTIISTSSPPGRIDWIAFSIYASEL